MTSDKPRNMMVESPSGYPTGDSRTTTYVLPSAESINSSCGDSNDGLTHVSYTVPHISTSDPPKGSTADIPIKESIRDNIYKP